MPTEQLEPTGGDGGWTSGDWTDLLANDDGFMETTIEDDEVIIDFSNSAVKDDDTVTKVYVFIRHQKGTGSGSTCQIGIEIDVGGGPIGSISQPLVEDTWQLFQYSTVLWEVDWTAAEMDNLQVIFRADRAGMPSSNTWRMDRVYVRADYDLGGAVVIPLHMAQYQPG